MSKNLLILTAILTIALTLATIFEAFLRELFIVPFLYLFWISRYLFESLPQGGVWLGFCLMAVFILGRGLLGKPSPQLTQPILNEPPPQRIEGWLISIYHAPHNNYHKHRLAHQLQKLALDKIAHQQGKSVHEIRRQLRQGQLDLPPDIQRYLQAALNPLQWLTQPSWRTLWRRKPTPLDLEPQRLMDYLETLS